VPGVLVCGACQGAEAGEMAAVLADKRSDTARLAEVLEAMVAAIEGLSGSVGEALRSLGKGAPTSGREKGRAS
jgi:hypothetical protein